MHMQGRENAAIIVHNWRQGRRKALWLSSSASAWEDAAVRIIPKIIPGITMSKGVE